LETAVGSYIVILNEGMPAGQDRCQSGNAGSRNENIEKMEARIDTNTEKFEVL
jgi:hypothetical protein